MIEAKVILDAIKPIWLASAAMAPFGTTPALRAKRFYQGFPAGKVPFPYLVINTVSKTRGSRTNVGIYPELTFDIVTVSDTKEDADNLSFTVRQVTMQATLVLDSAWRVIELEQTDSRDDQGEGYWAVHESYLGKLARLRLD